MLNAITMRLLPLFLLAASAAFPQSTPPPAPNAAGISWLHVHLIVRNVQAERDFWMAIGGQSPSGGRGVVLGGTDISIGQGESNGGSEGTAIDHVAYRVKDLPGLLAKVEPAGGKVLPGATGKTANVTSPEGVKLEFIADPAIADAIQQDHVHLSMASAAQAQEWFAKTLGGVRGGNDSMVNIPGVVLRINEGKTPAPSKGHSLDHIAFGVTPNLTEFCKKLEAMGVQHEAINKAGTSGRGFTYITGPNGIYIELMGTI